MTKILNSLHLFIKLNRTDTMEKKKDSRAEINTQKKHDKLNPNSVEDLEHSDIVIGDENNGPNEKVNKLPVPSSENLFALSGTTSNKNTKTLSGGLSKKIIKTQKVQLNNLEDLVSEVEKISEQIFNQEYKQVFETKKKSRLDTNNLLSILYGEGGLENIQCEIMKNVILNNGKTQICYAGLDNLKHPNVNQNFADLVVQYQRFEEDQDGIGERAVKFALAQILIDYILSQKNEKPTVDPVELFKETCSEKLEIGQFQIEFVSADKSAEIASVVSELSDLSQVRVDSGLSSNPQVIAPEIGLNSQASKMQSQIILDHYNFKKQLDITKSTKILLPVTKTLELCEENIDSNSRNPRQSKVSMPNIKNQSRYCSLSTKSRKSFGLNFMELIKGKTPVEGSQFMSHKIFKKSSFGGITPKKEDRQDTDVEDHLKEAAQELCDNIFLKALKKDQTYTKFELIELAVIENENRQKAEDDSQGIDGVSRIELITELLDLIFESKSDGHQLSINSLILEIKEQIKDDKYFQDENEGQQFKIDIEEIEGQESPIIIPVDSKSLNDDKSSSSAFDQYQNGFPMIKIKQEDDFEKKFVPPAFKNRDQRSNSNFLGMDRQSSIISNKRQARRQGRAMSSVYSQSGAYNMHQLDYRNQLKKSFSVTKNGKLMTLYDIKTLKEFAYDPQMDMNIGKITDHVESLMVEMQNLLDKDRLNPKMRKNSGEITPQEDQNEHDYIKVRFEEILINFYFHVDQMDQQIDQQANDIALLKQDLDLQKDCQSELQLQWDKEKENVKIAVEYNQNLLQENQDLGFENQNLQKQRDMAINDYKQLQDKVQILEETIQKTQFEKKNEQIKQESEEKQKQISVTQTCAGENGEKCRKDVVICVEDQQQIEADRALLKKIQIENKRLCEAILKSKKQCEDIGDDKEQLEHDLMEKNQKYLLIQDENRQLTQDIMFAYQKAKSFEEENKIMREMQMNIQNQQHSGHRKISKLNSQNSLYYLEYGNEYTPEGKQRRVSNVSGGAFQTDDEILLTSRNSSAEKAKPDAVALELIEEGKDESVSHNINNDLQQQQEQIRISKMESKSENQPELGEVFDAQLLNRLDGNNLNKIINARNQHIQSTFNFIQESDFTDLFSDMDQFNQNKDNLNTAETYKYFSLALIKQQDFMLKQISNMHKQMENLHNNYQQQIQMIQSSQGTPCKGCHILKNKVSKYQRDQRRMTQNPLEESGDIKSIMISIDRKQKRVQLQKDSLTVPQQPKKKTADPPKRTNNQSRQSMSSSLATSYYVQRLQNRASIQESHLYQQRVKYLLNKKQNITSMYKARKTGLNTTINWGNSHSRQIETKSKSFNLLMRDSFMDDFIEGNTQHQNKMARGSRIQNAFDLNENIDEIIDIDQETVKSSNNDFEFSAILDEHHNQPGRPKKTQQELDLIKQKIVSKNEIYNMICMPHTSKNPNFLNVDGGLQLMQIFNNIHARINERSSYVTEMQTINVFEESENTSHNQKALDMHINSKRMQLYSEQVYFLQKKQLVECLLIIYDGKLYLFNTDGDEILWHIVDVMEDIGGVVKCIKSQKDEKYQCISLYLKKESIKQKKFRNSHLILVQNHRDNFQKLVDFINYTKHDTKVGQIQDLQILKKSQFEEMEILENKKVRNFSFQEIAFYKILNIQRKLEMGEKTRQLRDILLKQIKGSISNHWVNCLIELKQPNAHALKIIQTFQHLNCDTRAILMMDDKAKLEQEIHEFLIFNSGQTYKQDYLRKVKKSDSYRKALLDIIMSKFQYILELQIGAADISSGKITQKLILDQSIRVEDSHATKILDDSMNVTDQSKTYNKQLEFSLTVGDQMHRFAAVPSNKPDQHDNIYNLNIEVYEKWYYQLLNIQNIITYDKCSYDLTIVKIRQFITDMLNKKESQPIETKISQAREISNKYKTHSKGEMKREFNKFQRTTQTDFKNNNVRTFDMKTPFRQGQEYEVIDVEDNSTPLRPSYYSNSIADLQLRQQLSNQNHEIQGDMAEIGSPQSSQNNSPKVNNNQKLLGHNIRERSFTSDFKTKRNSYQMRASLGTLKGFKELNDPLRTLNRRNMLHTQSMQVDSFKKSHKLYTQSLNSSEARARVKHSSFKEPVLQQIKEERFR